MKIEFVSSNENAAKYFPPMPAGEMIPRWYKDLSLYTTEKRMDAKELHNAGKRTQPYTVKACVPVQDYIKHGYIIRSHGDLLITPDDIGDEQGWWTASKNVTCEPHTYQQCPVHINDKKNVYIKVCTPWMTRTPPGYSCYFYQPEFFMESRIRFFPAVVDTDSFHHELNFPAVLLTDKTFTIKAGDPLVAVFPFKREKWAHEVKHEELKENPIRMFFEHGYRRFFRKNKEFK